MFYLQKFSTFHILFHLWGVSNLKRVLNRLPTAALRGGNGVDFLGTESPDHLTLPPHEAGATIPLSGARQAVSCHLTGTRHCARVRGTAERWGSGRGRRGRYHRMDRVVLGENQGEDLGGGHLESEVAPGPSDLLPYSPLTHSASATAASWLASNLPGRPLPQGLCTDQPLPGPCSSQMAPFSAGPRFLLDEPLHSCLPLSPPFSTLFATSGNDANGNSHLSLFCCFSTVR